jgi:hypothetical protein
MASDDTLFVCLLCSQRIEPKPPVHACQKECHRPSGIHHDFCSHCQNVNLSLFEYEVSGERSNGELHGDD